MVSCAVLHAHAVLCYAVQYDLDDNGKLDSNEFVKMLQSLGTDVSKDEADAAMEVGRGQQSLPCLSAKVGVRAGALHSIPECPSC